MAWLKNEGLGTNVAKIYEIRLQGRLDENWSDWLEGMVISHDDDTTVLRGKVLDQAALRGILSRIWDLNRTVISVNQIGETEGEIKRKSGGKESPDKEVRKWPRYS
jgi:hypothetical protein